MHPRNPNDRLTILKYLQLIWEQALKEPVPGAIAVDDLMAALRLSEQRVRRACEAMEADGLVKGRQATDQRNRLYHITDRGKTFLCNVVPPQNETD